jgi:Zn-finger nucleic acid-binding protein
MNCANCGTAMELIESRRYFFCRHCGSFHFPEPADTEGIRIVGRTADAPSCPVCNAPLAQALLDDAHPVHFCATCRGVLMPRPTFAGVVSLRRAWASHPPVEPQPLDQRALERNLACPSCRARLTTHPYYGPGNVVIDSCETCDVIWLDFGELKQIADAPGSDRGGRNRALGDEYYIPRRFGEGGGLLAAADPLDFLFDLSS